MAVLAAGLEEHDAVHDYNNDVFCGLCKDGYDWSMAVDYVRHALELSHLSSESMAARFNRDLGRAIRCLSPRPAASAAMDIINLHQRHGQTVERVVIEQLQKHENALLGGDLPGTSLLAMVAGQVHQVPVWQRYADRIADLLENGLPKSCKTHKPKNEPHLQEICDGILSAHDGQLAREFPFLRWGSNLTKPDWSAEDLRLWVELKYVRKQGDVRQIGAAIAEDITKYGDNQRNVVYVVYDPSHIITDEREFAEPIVSRETMQVRFIR